MGFDLSPLLRRILKALSVLTRKSPLKENGTNSDCQEGMGVGCVTTGMS